MLNNCLPLWAFLFFKVKAARLQPSRPKNKLPPIFVTEISRGFSFNPQILIYLYRGFSAAAYRLSRNLI